jgi:hypothetical protein
MMQKEVNQFFWGSTNLREVNYSVGSLYMLANLLAPILPKKGPQGLVSTFRIR